MREKGLKGYGRREGKGDLPDKVERYNFVN